MRRQIEVFLWILIQKWSKFQKQINLFFIPILKVYIFE